MGVSMLFLGPFGGALADRLSKRGLLMISQSVLALVFLLIGVAIITDLITIWLLVASSLVMGTMFPIMGPPRQAMVGDMLRGPLLANGVALQQMGMNGTRLVGPFLAGALIAVPFIDTGGTYLAIAVSFGFVVLLLLMMAPSVRGQPSGRSLVSDVVSGVGYTWRSRDLRLLTLVFFGVVVTGFSYQTLMPGFVENTLDRPARDIGLMFGLAAVGGTVVSVLLAGRPASANPRRAMLVYGALVGLSVIGLAVAPTFLAALGAMVAVGALSSGFQLLNNVNLMERSAPEYYGRITALTMMAFGSQAIVGYPLGLIADAIGERVTLAGCGCCVLVVVLAGVVLPALVRGEDTHSGAQPRPLP
jgi:MFS family permease